MRGRRPKPPPDRISALPEDTIEKILTHMPFPDALRTSILSKKWRYCWTKMPKLVFDGDMVHPPSTCPEMRRYKTSNCIFHVLLLRRVPISEVCLKNLDVKLNEEIDQIILHLSWSKSMKKFSFECAINCHKLPYSFFTMQGLEYLELSYCELVLPKMFNGFSMLKSVIFENVYIPGNQLCRFLNICPLIEEFSLIRYQPRDFVGRNRCTFVELFKYLPLVQVVNIGWVYNTVIQSLTLTFISRENICFNNSFGIWLKAFYLGCTSQKLPTSLLYLRILVLEVCLREQDVFSSALCLINSSPNLEKITLKIVTHIMQTVTMVDPENYLDLKLDHLKEFEITCYHSSEPEMEFVKLIMAKSPLLKKARIELDYTVSVDEENKMLRDFLLQPFPRASPSAKFLIQRQKCFTYMDSD